LRERPDDVPLLTRHFLQKSARELRVEPKQLTDAALKVLAQFGYPGNVRQIENICHWLTVMAPGQVIEATDLPPEVREAQPAATAALTGISWLQALDREAAQSLARGEQAVADRLQQEFEKTLIRRALQHTGGQRIKAAQQLGWGRNTLTRKIQELGLEEKD
jgi:two-component system nitrogen regulation response regulator GlnG